MTQGVVAALGTVLVALVGAVAGAGVTRAQMRKVTADADSTNAATAAEVVGLVRGELRAYAEETRRLRAYTGTLAAVLVAHGIPVPPPPDGPA